MTESAAPMINTLNAPFWSGAARGCLVLPFCIETGRAFWPPSPISPFRSSGGVVWREVDPVGVLISRVVYHRGFQAAFKDRMPYGVGLVALPIGPRLQVHLSDPNAQSAAQVGRPIRIAFEDVLGDGGRIPVGLAIR